jgi:predicted AlkP superfamily phosphohydrolase/phosphomutase
MRRRVVAIGIDSVDPQLLERYMASGVLERIGRLRQRGAISVLSNRAHFAGGIAPQSITEGLWVEFQTGVRSNKSGYWTSVRYDPESYEVRSDPVYGGYDYREFPPFYALGEEFRIATLDVPVAALCDGVHGAQILGWGGHYPFVVPGSRPEGLLAEISAKYGSNEILYRDSGVFWNREYLEWLERASIDSARARGRLCLDLMNRKPWDLFLAVFSESHGAIHDLWFGGHTEHPVHAAWQGAHDPLASVFRAIDEAVGAIEDNVPEDCYFVLFSVNGCAPNVADVATFFLLPELLYRFNFPGRIGFAAGNSDSPPSPPLLRGRHRSWYGEIWRHMHVQGRLRQRLNKLLPPWLLPPPSSDLRFPYFMDRTGAECGWMPAQWYRPAWPRMRAFALPAFADGHVRINLQGREPAGVVREDEYEAECNRIAEFLLRVKNARTGSPFVREVFRTRRAPRDDDSSSPSADLVAIFDEAPVDVVDSPDVGRIGPVPFYRTGGHSARGFAMATGPGIRSGHRLAESEAVDLGPTILDMLGAAVPDRFDGRSWLAAAKG